MGKEVCGAISLYLFPNWAWKKACEFRLPKRVGFLVGGEDFLLSNGECETNDLIGCQLGVEYIDSYETPF